MAAGPAVPHDRPQRRDQHVAGQCRPDAGPREDHGRSGVDRGHVGVVSDPPAGRQRLGLLRQRDGVAGPGRPLRAPRPDDDDSRGVRAALLHLDRQAGVLRVPRRDHGAVGRAGGHAVHRRPAGGRHLGPQRLAALPLRGDDRRAGGPGQRGGRDRVPARASSTERPPSARPDVPGRYGRGPDRRRQRDQGQGFASEALPAVAGREPHRVAGVVSALEADPQQSQNARPASPLVRLHPRGVADGRRADGGQRPGAGRLDGHRHAAGRALRPAQAVVQLFQAVVRPGHQPADRPAARRAGDVVDVVHRQAAEPVG